MTMFFFSRNLIVTAVEASNAPWIAYHFPTSLLLACILLIVGIGLVLLGRRLKSRVQVPHPGGMLKLILIAVWVLSLSILLRGYLLRKRLFPGAIQSGPVFPITIALAICTFVYLAYIYRREGITTMLGNGFLGAAAGPMVFEFPFDLIVLPQVKAPTTYMIAFFVPLLVAVLLTLSVFMLSSRVSLTKYSLYSAGAMFKVLAAWALIGFSYPSEPASFILNAVAKVLSFISIAALFSITKYVANGIS